jgi:hypothetical protein
MSYEAADSFQDALRAADPLLFAFVELHDGGNVLTDLVGLGFDRRVPDSSMGAETQR